jgi:hypothetical protein
MARQITIPSQEYTTTGGPLGDGRYTVTVDSFPANIDRIRISLSREAWPVGPVARIYALWDDGSGINGSQLSGGVALGKDGLPATHSVVFTNVPFIADGQGGRRKKNVATGVFTLEVLQPFTTEIVAEAI